MPLQKQLIPQPFAGGIDTKTEAKLVRYPSMLQLDNATIEDAGSIKKRDGYVALGVDVPSAEALFEHQGQLLCADGANLHRYANSSWKSVGAAASAKMSIESISGGGNDRTRQSRAATDTFECMAWVSNLTEVRIATRDLTSGAFYFTEKTLYTGTSITKIFVLAVSDLVYVVVGDTGVFKIFILRSASTEPELKVTEYITSSTTMDWVAFYFPDMGITGGNDFGWGILGVHKDPATTTLGIYGYAENITGAILRITTDSTDQVVALTYDLVNVEAGFAAADWGALVRLAMPPQGGFPRILIHDGGAASDLYYIELDFLAAGTLKASVNLTGGAADAKYASIYAFPATTTLTGLGVVFTNAYTSGNTYYNDVTTELGAFTTTLAHYQLAPITKAFLMGTNRYVLAYYTSSLQTGLYLLNCDERTIVGKALYTTASMDSFNPGPQTVNLTKLSAAIDVHGEDHWFAHSPTAVIPVMYKARVDQVNIGFNNTVTVLYDRAMALLTVDTAHNHRYMNAELGENLHIAGGFVQAYDGAQLYEHGFFTFPEGVTATDTGAGALAAGNYIYKVIYEWTDAKGQVHRSAASPSITCATGANRQNTVTYPNYRFGNRTLTDVRIGIYRTQVGGTSVFYRVTTVSASPTNDPTAATTTYVDNIVDATIATHDTLYTVGGELDNDPPPPCQIMISAKNRLWAVDEWGKLWYSKEYRPGEAVGFSLFLSKQIPQYGGAITALGLVDDKLIVFKGEKTFALAGEGPTPDGQNDTFSLATELPAKVGCENPLSVVEYDDGVLFKSSKGIYLLDRSLNARYVGQGVHAYNDLTITAAIGLPAKNQVRFITSDGVTLVYDYEQRDANGVGLWSTFSNLESYDAVVWQDSLRLLTTTSEVLTETAGTFTDNGEYITTTVETGWFAPTGPQGWKRLYRVFLLGEKKSEHILNVGLAYNYLGDDQGLVQFDTTDLADASYGAGVFGANPYGNSDEGDLYQFRINPAKQECSAVKIRIWDTGHAGTGESFTLTDLTFEVGMKSLGGTGTKLSSGRSG